MQRRGQLSINFTRPWGTAEPYLQPVTGKLILAGRVRQNLGSAFKPRHQPGVIQVPRSGFNAPWLLERSPVYRVAL